MLTYIVSTRLPTTYGVMELRLYDDGAGLEVPVVLPWGAVGRATDERVPVRVHSSCFTGD